MSMRSGASRVQYVVDVPHVAQNVRTTRGVELNSAGAPCVKRKSLRRTVAHATACAPAARLQVSQWHTAAGDTGSLHS